MLKNLSLRKKLMSGFLLVSLITVIVALSGIFGLKSIRTNFREVLRSAPLIDAAMEMKIAVARDMQMIMELLAAESKADLDAVWDEHETFAQNFDTFADAVLNGAETEEGMIHATDDQELRNIVKEADQFHNDEFQPKIREIYEIMTAKFAGRTYSEEKLAQDDKQADQIGETMLELLGTIEDIARENIQGSQLRTASTTDFQIKLLTIAGIAGLAVSILLGFFMTKIITGPVFRARDFAGSIAEGDLSQNIDIKREDEIGMLANSLNTMCDNLRGMFGKISEEVQVLTQSSSDLAEISGRIASNSEQTVDKSNTVASATEEMNTNMNTIASATEQTASNIQMIVSAAEEMTTTIQEISGNTTKGSEVTESAVRQAKEVSEKVDELSQAAGEINKVTETIADISEQTNLLALNATIEASRAGEAGKGFAVVAAEIKALAQQTAEATQDISKKISGVQNTTSQSVTAIESIVGVINEINDIVTSVSSAIEEQSSTTQEISNNVSQAAEGVQEVNENVNQISSVTAEVAQNVNEVNQAAEETNNGNKKVNSSSSELARIADNLTEMISQFKLR